MCGHRIFPKNILDWADVSALCKRAKHQRRNDVRAPLKGRHDAALQNGANPNAPTQAGKEYYQYFTLHSDVPEEMNPFFDVYDFTNPGDTGTVRLEELRIESREIPDDGWISKSVPPFGTWTCVNGPGVYYNVGSGILSGLRLSSTLYNSFHYGFWGTGRNGAMKFEPTDKIYRAVFTVRTADENSPWCMLRINSQDQQVAHRFTVYAPAQSGPDGNQYTLYFTRHEIAYGYDGFDLFFELADFNYTKAGALTLSKVRVEHKDISFYPYAPVRQVNSRASIPFSDTKDNIAVFCGSLLDNLNAPAVELAGDTMMGKELD